MSALVLWFLLFCVLVAIAGAINEALYRIDRRYQPRLWNHRGKGGQP